MAQLVETAERDSDLQRANDLMEEALAILDKWQEHLPGAHLDSAICQLGLRVTRH